MVLFFDGVCGLCNGFVDFLLRHDRVHRLRFAPLQGETAKTRIPVSFQNLSTLVLEKDGRLFTGSDAAIYAVCAMGGAWRFVGVFRCFPRFIREGAYRFVASNRYKWFGKLDTCRRPSTISERPRFLA